MKNLRYSFAMQDVCNTINLGLMIIGPDMQITFWNRWLIERTRIESDDAIDKKLNEVFSEPIALAFIGGVKQALSYGLPAILSNALHGSPLPLYRGQSRDVRNRIDQSITISPIRADSGERCCMIQILDASRSVKRESILRAYSRKLRSEASTDSLTGIANRRAFDELSITTLASAKKRKSAISVFMIDIDFFKQYNDHYGHSAGDKALKAVANALNAQVLRVTDQVARYGGEEFIVLMNGLSPEQADNFAEKMRLTVTRCELPHAQSSAAEHVTISIGVYTCIPGSDVEMKELIERADRALYEAKRHGRNRSFQEIHAVY
jgi:diguanylate cyclase (GGDEF)-like protein